MASASGCSTKEVTGSTFEKSVENAKHELATSFQEHSPELIIKALMIVFPEWTFEAYPPSDGDGLSHNGQSENGNNVDVEVGGSKPVENQASHHLDPSTAPASGYGGVAVEPPLQYELPLLMPDNAEASAAPKVEPAPKK